MKNKYYFLVIILLIIGFVIGCFKDKHHQIPPPYIIGHYIWSYAKATPNMMMYFRATTPLPDGKGSDTAIQNFNSFIFSISYFTYNDNVYVYHDNISSRYEKYLGLANQYGDTNYNKNDQPRKAGSNARGFLLFSPALLDTISNITITCNKDYDASHPAGSSLNDIIRITYVDPKPMIYSKAAIDTGIGSQNTYKNTRLDSFNTIHPDSNFLIGLGSQGGSGGIRFMFIISPTYTDLYKFAVVMTLKNGMVFSFPTTKTTSFVDGWNGVVKLQGSKQ